MIETLPTLSETEFSMRHYQEAAIQAAMKWLWEDGESSGIIQSMWSICSTCNGSGDGDIGYCRQCQGDGYIT